MKEVEPVKREASLSFFPIEFILFVGTFALYAFTAGPYVVPYRDAGEMITVLSTLGVAHPPGYPLYTLMGKIAMLLPMGSAFYRANLFSALCAALAIAVLFGVLRRLLSAPAALAACVALALSNLFWELASVSEMYTLGVLWFALLLWAAFVRRDVALWAFLMGLALGVRMDMLLLIPFFLIWFFYSSPLVGEGREGGVGLLQRRPSPNPAHEGRGTIILASLAFGAGISLFLYLMVRSRTDPIMDWGNPDTLLGVFRSATRKSYSGTLDLLSLSYHPGENFIVNMKLYAEHVLHAFGVLGGAFAALGFAASLKRQRALTLWFLSVFMITGPVFFYLANMPPNPHAIAIVEASYLIPDVIIAIGIGFAIQSAFGWKPASGKILLVAALMLTALNVPSSFHRADKRNNFYARDFVANIFRSLPSGAVAVFHKDVQLFSLWSAQLVEGRRPDAAILSTGLSASPWFWEMRRRWNVAPCPEISIKNASGWKAMKAALGARPLIAGYDVDLPSDIGFKIAPRGYVSELVETEGPFDPAGAQICSVFSLNRGRAVYGETPDFFSTDLIGDAARALHQTGISALSHNIPAVAAFYFAWSEHMDPTFPRPAADSGYLYFISGDYSSACASYARALHKSEERLALARQYNSLPDVINGCLFDLATTLTQLGASTEKLGHIDQARDAYLRSLSVQESAQAHYNLAVTYWGKDWPLVISHMQRAVELNPGMSEARTYLAKAMAINEKK